MKKIRPCDCKDSGDVSLLYTDGIGHNNQSIVVEPNSVILTMDHTTIKIPMSRFKMFAEWYLEEQDIVINSELHNYKSIDFDNHTYWYNYQLANHNKDICLATTNPNEYCNGLYLYSEKDSGNGMAYVVISSTNDFYNKYYKLKIR